MGTSQLKVFARLFQKAAGETAAKASRGFWPLSRAAPFLRAAALIKARPAGRKNPVQALRPPQAKSVTDAMRLDADFAGFCFPLFEKSLAKNLSRLRREQWDERYVKRSEQIRLLRRTKADATSLAMADAFLYNIKDSRARGADNPALCIFIR